MRSLNEVILNAGNASGNLVSDGVSLEYQLGFSMQAVITGAPIGTLSLQGSNDSGFNGPGGGPVHGQNVVNWTDISNSSQPVTGAGTASVNFQGVFYKWVRMIYIATSGAGTITIRCNTKGF